MKIFSDTMMNEVADATHEEENPQAAFFTQLIIRGGGTQLWETDVESVGTVAAYRLGVGVVLVETFTAGSAEVFVSIAGGRALIEAVEALDCVATGGR